MLALVAVHQPPRLAQLVESRDPVRAGIRLRPGRASLGTPHLLRRLSQRLRRLPQFRALLFARQPFQAPRELFRFLDQVLLSAAATAALLRAAPQPVLTLVLALLAAGQLAELLHEFVDFRLRLLRGAALDRFVLVAQFVELELEQIRQILGQLLIAAATAAALLERDAHVAEHGLRALQRRQGLLLLRQRLLGTLRFELLLRHGHLDIGLPEKLDDLREIVVLEQLLAAVAHPRDQGCHLFAQPTLHQGNRLHVLGQFLGRVLVLVADQAERCRDDHLLLHR